MLGDVSQSTNALDYGRGIVCRRALVVPGIVCMMLSLLACGTAGSGGRVSPALVARAAAEPPSGSADPGLEQFDALIEGILARADIPGASLAMAADSRHEGPFREGLQNAPHLGPSPSPFCRGASFYPRSNEWRHAGRRRTGGIGWGETPSIGP
jgi:hypothetical protein